VNTHIGLNLLYLVPDIVGGTETYARELVRAMAADSPGNFRFTVFLNHAAWDSFDWLEDANGWQRVRCDIPLTNWRRHLWEQLVLPRVCWEHGIDLLHSLGYVIPLRVRCKQVVTIHDALFLTGPRHLSLKKRWFWSVFVSRGARSADAVITDSENSRRELERLLNLGADKLHAVLLGPGQPLPAPTQWEELQAQYRIEKPFFLSVGAWSHKRTDVTADALQQVRRQQPSASLVVTGQLLKPPTGALRSPGVHWIGFVPRADLAGLYANATALVCVSEVEGFGLPVTEAMSFGTPVIVSDRGSLPEVVGSAGIVVPYDDPTALAAAMQSAATLDEARTALGQQGREQARRFSWERCAQETLNVYAAVLQTPIETADPVYGGR
jgi:glycosyltransferase involved in cell wall biosynthesis